MKRLLHTYHVVFEDGKDLAASDTEAPAALNRILGMNPSSRPVEFYRGSKVPIQVNGITIAAAWIPQDLPPNARFVAQEKRERAPKQPPTMFDDEQIKAESKMALSRQWAALSLQ